MALTSNQISGIFQSKVGRLPTPEEATKFSNASFDKLSQLDKVNFSSYPNQQHQTNQPNQPDVSGATIQAPAPVQAPAQAQAPAQQEQPQTNQYEVQHQQALSEYTVAQKHVSDIDKTLNDSFINKKREIEAQGGIVNETQLKAQIANEQAPLINQRKSLVASQSLAGKNLSDTKSLYVGEANRIATAKNQAARLAQAGQEFQARQNQQAGQFATTADQRQQGIDQKPTLQANNFQQQDKVLDIKNQQAQHLITLRASMAGTNQDVSKELAEGIQNGQFDASKINNRNIKIYNDLAKLGVDAISSSLSSKERGQVVTQATKWATQAKISAGVLDKNFPILIDLADKTKGFDAPAINAAFIAGKKYTSTDPNITKYVSILETLRSEYASLLSKGNQSNESTRKDAVNAIQAGLTSEQYKELGDQLQVEGVNIVDMAQGVVDSAKSNTLSSKGSSSAQGSVKLKNGAVIDTNW